MRRSPTFRLSRLRHPLRPLNICEVCSWTWYPRGHDLAYRCPRCESNRVIREDGYGASGCGCLVLIVLIVLLVKYGRWGPATTPSPAPPPKRAPMQVTSPPSPPPAIEATIGRARLARTNTADGSTSLLLWANADHSGPIETRFRRVRCGQSVVLLERRGRAGYPDELFRIRTEAGEEGWIERLRLEGAPP